MCLMIDDEENLSQITELSLKFAKTAIILTEQMENRISYDIDGYYEVYGWAQILHELVKTSTSSDDNQLNVGYMYKDIPIGCNLHQVYKDVQQFFKFLLKISIFYLNNNDNVHNKVMKNYHNFDSLNDANINQHFILLSKLLSSLQKYQYDFIAYRIVHQFCAFFKFINMQQLPKTIQDFILQKSYKWETICRQTLLKKIIVNTRNDQKFDIHLALSLLNAWGYEEALKWLKHYIMKFSNNNDLLKLTSICQLSIVYNNEHKIVDSTINIDPIFDSVKTRLLRAKWALKLHENRLIILSTTDVLNLPMLKLLPFIINNLQKLQEESIGFDAEHQLNEFKKQLTIILDFVNDFNVDIHFLLVRILKILLSEWKPTMNNILLQQCQLIVSKLDNKLEIKQHLDKIYEEQSNFYYYEIYLCVIEIYKQFNIINNEECINKYERDMQLLNYLITYKRKAEVQQDEICLWKKKYQDSINLPEISKTRLPFITNQDLLLKIIRPELNIYTCEQWIHIGRILKLNKDQLYVYSIKQTTLHLNNTKSTNCNINVLHLNILDQILNLAKNIENIQLSMGVLYHVTNEIPIHMLGDRLYAAEHSYDYAKEVILDHNQSNEFEAYQDSNDTPCIENIKKLYENTKCLYILYNNGIINNIHVYSDKMNNIELLMKTLYEHESIINNDSSNIDCNKPNINAATEEIAQLYQFNISKYRFDLIEQLLQHNNTNMSYNHTIDDFHMIIESTFNSNTTDADITKICYILQSIPIQDAIQYLINLGIKYEDRILFDLNPTTRQSSPSNDNNYDDQTFANITFTFNGNCDSGEQSEVFDRTDCFSNTNIHINNPLRYKALKCLMSIASDEEILQYMKSDNGDDSTPMEFIYKYIRTLWYIIQIESFGITSYTIQRLLTCDKLRLINDLYAKYLKQTTTNSITRRHCILLIISIMIEYNIIDETLWNNMFNMMIQFNMVNELRYIIKYLTSLNNNISIHIICLSSYINGWQYLIEYPFKYNTKNKYEEYIQSLLLLFNCPIQSELNINNIIKYCLSTINEDNKNDVYMAAIISSILSLVHHYIINNQSISITLYKQLIKQLYVKYKKTDLFKNIQELISVGIVISNQTIKMLENEFCLLRK